MPKEQLLKFIKGICRNKQVAINPETLLFKEKVLDSMNILDLMGYIEKYLGRRLTDSEIVASNFESIRKIEETFLKKS
ncbi:MAG: acyl carrier protein [Candidatus Zambryskibacteria bacterium]|nr:acyl carrier protein [Candidatus Zambryskibacteria bacterium]